MSTSRGSILPRDDYLVRLRLSLCNIAQVAENRVS